VHRAPGSAVAAVAAVVEDGDGAEGGDSPFENGA
jgi:hypothetical protein